MQRHHQGGRSAKGEENEAEMGSVSGWIGIQVSGVHYSVSPISAPTFSSALWHFHSLPEKWMLPYRELPELLNVRSGKWICFVDKTNPQRCGSQNSLGPFEFY